jgi:hypothetical protein
MEKENSLSQKISEKMVAVLILTLFTLTLWGGFKIIEAFTPKEKETDLTDSKVIIPVSLDERVLQELIKRKEGYELVDKKTFTGEEDEKKPADTTGTDTTETDSTGN